MPIPLDRIRKLLALAGSKDAKGEPTNEARNAAMQACKLIAEHKVEVVYPGGADRLRQLDEYLARPTASPFAAYYPTPQGPRRTTSDAEEVMRTGKPVKPDGVGGMGRIVEDILGPGAGRIYRQAAGGGHPFVEPRSEVPGWGASAAKGDRIVVVQAQTAGICSDCGEPFDAGETVWFRQGVGAVHQFKCNTTVLENA